MKRILMVLTLAGLLLDGGLSFATPPTCTMTCVTDSHGCESASGMPAADTCACTYTCCLDCDYSALNECVNPANTATENRACFTTFASSNNTCSKNFKMCTP
jgi:hypothetical protein